MSASTGPAPDDQRLIRYLLGALPDAEAESLDELSIADDQFALHLSDVENDLVDAYVKGEMTGETMDRFRSHYLSSPANREKVAFAEALQAHQASAARTAAQLPVRRPLAFSRLPAWVLAAAAVLILTSGGMLLRENLRLRGQVNETRASTAALEARARQLQQQLDDRRSADSAAAKELAQARAALPVPAFLLLAATRGAGEAAAIAVPAGADAITLRLALESADGMPGYRAELKDPAGRVVWSGADLRATSNDGRKLLPITLNASQLRPQSYIIEVTGVPAGGTAEPIGNYPFTVVIR